MGSHSIAVWLGFSGLVAALLVLDLAVLNRRSHVLTLREAMSWSGGLIALALLFGLFVLWQEGPRHALEYYTGYLIELSLSVDNLFVFLLIFSYFGVRAEAQPKVLKWGILGAIVMRLIMIALGALLLQRFQWIVYVFGGLLILTGIRMFTQKEEMVNLERNPVVRLARSFFRSAIPTMVPGSSPVRPGVECWRHRCCWSSWWWNGLTWSSPSTASPRSLP